MGSQKLIYLDNAATTGVSDEVLEAMLPYLREQWGNPSSIYRPGRRAKAAVEHARGQLAVALGCEPEQILFTSCGTESDNWALVTSMELAAAETDARRGLVTSRIEHHAVLNTCSYLEEHGFAVTYVPVDGEGFVDGEAFDEAVDERTALVSVMLANNEVGTIEPVRQLAARAHERGALFHTDAVQAFAHVPVDVRALDVDFLSISGHKFHAPKGVGALYCKDPGRFAPLLHGGGQERGLRGGTENVAGIVGIGAAAETAARDLRENIARMSALRDHAIDRLLGELPDTRLNGPRDGQSRLPGNVNIEFTGIDSAGLIELLDVQGICVSGGSACSNNDAEVSHVLTALGRAPEEAASAIRISLGDNTTPEELDLAIDTIVADVHRLRSFSLM